MTNREFLAHQQEKNKKAKETNPKILETVEDTIGLPTGFVVCLALRMLVLLAIFFM